MTIGIKLTAVAAATAGTATACPAPNQTDPATEQGTAPVAVGEAWVVDVTGYERIDNADGSIALEGWSAACIPATDQAVAWADRQRFRVIDIPREVYAQLTPGAPCPDGPVLGTAGPNDWGAQDAPAFRQPLQPGQSAYHEWDWDQ